MGGDGLDGSITGRLEAWGTAFNMAIHHPLTGVGLDNFLGNYYLYAPRYDTKAAHSIWFSVMGTTGFVGFIVYTMLVGSTILRAYSAVRTILIYMGDNPEIAEETYIFSRGIFAGLVGFCVSGTFLSQAYNWFFFILLGLSVANQRYIYETFVKK